VSRRAIPISDKRKKWAEKFKPTAVVEGNPLNYNASIGILYTKELNKLINSMIKETQSQVVKLFTAPESKEYFEQSTGEDASISSQSRILMNELIKEFEKLFSDKAKSISEEMLGAVNNTSEASLKSSLKELSGGIAIDPTKATKNVSEVVKASIAENAELIKTIPTRYLTQIQGEVMRSITTGNGLQNLVPFFEKQKGITKRHAKNMALDQTRKAYNSVNKARMQDVGVNKFKWLHSGGGQTPRPHHIAKFPSGLNGGIFSFSDLPVIDTRTGERGIPGQAINCKCRMMPVIEFEDGEII